MVLPVVTRAILANENGQVLLGKRMRNNGVGQWALVGGKPDRGESPEQAVVREVKEEVNLDFVPVFYKEVVQQFAEDATPWRVIFYTGKFTGIPILKPDEIDDLAFVSQENLGTLDIAFNHREILEEYFKNR